MGDRDPKGKVVKKVRSEHGTRVARSIVCNKCGKTDTIHFAPRDDSHVFCRACASKFLGVVDEDARLGVDREAVCTDCGRTVLTDLPFEKIENFLCSDCFRGIETQQGNRTGSAARLSDKVLRVRRKQPDED